MGAFGSFYRKYAAAILFPTIASYLIYTDYSRTQRWKASLAEQNQLQLSS